LTYPVAEDNHYTFAGVDFADEFGNYLDKTHRYLHNKPLKRMALLVIVGFYWLV
jgi:hypothetical protein